MAEPCTAQSILHQRLNEPWLLGLDTFEFWKLFQRRLSELQGYAPTTRIVVSDREPVSFLATVFAACAAGQSIFLGNADWSPAEWKQAIRCIQPDLIWSSGAVDIPLLLSRNPDWLDQIRSPICIPTGGSSGQLRFAVHTWDTLMASVRGMQAHFNTQAIHSCCVLPLYHVSGFMQAVRSLTTGGTLAIAPSKDFVALQTYVPNPERYFLSLVPTQLQRCLEQPELVPWLQRVRAILVGGAPAWPSVLNQARQARLPLALTYGMTETASQVVTLYPEKFLNGVTCSGRSLPHAQLQVVNDEGQALPANQVGQIRIQAESLAWGYYPGERWRSRTFTTDDLGYLDSVGHLTVVGRHSDMIITGGENVHPSEVEAAILATELVADVCVVGQPDDGWGEVVTAVYRPHENSSAGSELEEAIASLLRLQLSTFKIPKRWIAQSTLSRNAQGKLNRAALCQQLMESGPPLSLNPTGPAPLAPSSRRATGS